MKFKTILIGLLMLDMAGVTIYAYVTENIFAFTGVLLKSAWGIQVIADILVALFCCAVWIYKDAKKRGLNPIPYFILTLLLGSVGPLTYFFLIQFKTDRLVQTQVQSG
ncbi:MAG: hypothetical protein PVI26_01915 [Chitinispirillia bacterium]|jgi:hypothetical protein